MKAIAIVMLLATIGHQAPQSAPPQSRDKPRVPSVGTATIRGVVTADEPNAAPLRRVIVRISGSALENVSSQVPSVNRTAVTDDQGRYVIPNLPAGRFYVSAEKGGWVMLRYGAQGQYDAGIQIAVADGQAAVIDMKLIRGAVIAGRVTDEHGLPQAGARPILLEYRNVNGQQRLMRAPTLMMMALNAQTNDLGEYRLYGIPPGAYVVAVQPGFQSTASGATMRVTTNEEVAWARQQPSSATTLPGSAGQTPQQGQGVIMTPVYYPGVTDAAAAATVTVAAGEQRLGIDLVTAFVPTARVRGVVLRPDGVPAVGTRVQLTRARAAMSPLDTSIPTATVDAKGEFTFPSVASGEFVINARAASQPAPPPGAGASRQPAVPVLDLWGTTSITVGGRDLDGVLVTLQPGVTVTGRVAFESASGTAAPAPTGVRLTLYAASVFEVIGGPVSISNISMSSANADGTFAFQGQAPGRYVLTSSIGGVGTSWMQKALTIGGRPVPDGALEIRAGEDLSDVAVLFTDQVSEVSGTLLHADGSPAPEYHVFVFPVDKTRWSAASMRMRAPVRPASDGRYRVTSLQPGEYYMAALSRFDPNNLFDTAFLEQVAAAAFKITLAEGEKKVQDLKTR